MLSFSDGMGAMRPGWLEAACVVALRLVPIGIGWGNGGYGWAMNATVLWVIAVILAIVGIVQLLQGQVILGIIVLIAAAAVGPGGWSVFRSRA